METKTNVQDGDGIQITLNIPADDTGLFGSEAIDDILYFLSRHHEQRFAITDITEAVQYSRPTVSKAVKTLKNNGLVVDRREAGSRLVQINKKRLSIPEDPYFRIPQAEFREPVKEGIHSLMQELHDIIAIVLYGSVAQGEADRKSDIDLWVLVREDRMRNQRVANDVRKELEEMEVGNDRYGYDIDVESLKAIPNYQNDIQKILSRGIPIYTTQEFDTVQSMVLHGERDE
jgi:predicted nucleotidyltransferase/biotin operon repressor